MGIHKELEGIHKQLHQSIQNCDLDARMDLMKNIIVSGGSTMFPGLVERMTKEMKELAEPGARDEINIEAPGERKFSVWCGGAVLAGSGFDQWLTKSDYEEQGASAVH